MSFEIVRVIQAAVAVAVLETLINAYPFHPFYPLPTAMYAVLEALFYLVIICIAAFIATRIPSSIGWAQKLVFFVLVVTPSLISSYFFYRDVSFYSQGGRALVTDHRVTTAGFEHLLTNLGVAALLALVAALIYFRANPQPHQA
ncbi:MAG: hypothetical protein WDM86_02815 [Rhizomicrobium sp.]